MSITSAKHYHDELKKWQESINFFINTALELEQHLDDVVKRNSIVDIAAKVEVHQLMLNNIVDKLHYLQKEILLQISFLLKDEKLIEDNDITNDFEMQHTSLTERVKKIEKEFVDVEFYCNAFITEILK